MKHEMILLNHGSGGRLTRQLIDEVFGRHFANPQLDGRTDASIISLSGSTVAFTTDSFVVDPRSFPGGDIGKLAVCGTVNDIAVSGAVPVALSASFIIEEGFSIAELDTIASSMAETAAEAGVSIVTGDTKVVNHGKADGVFITTTGLGTIKPHLSGIGAGVHVQAGDKVIINGPVGDHGMAILAARNDLPFKAQVRSDCAPLNKMIQAIMDEYGDHVTFMRDATRGGLGTVVCELAEMVQSGITIDEHSVPVRQVVRSMCEMFGFDPLFIANEGKVVMVVRPQVAEQVVDLLRSESYGEDAAVIGEINGETTERVTLKTAIGGSRIIAIPAGDQLPRIC